MSQIQVISHTQVIVVDPDSGEISIVSAGPPEGSWIALSQAAYDALPFKNPNTTYVITS